MAPDSNTLGWPGTLLIADDAGLTPGCDRAIFALADAGRLSGTSALTNFAHWPETAARLRALRPGLAVGLHINLTEGPPLTASPLEDGTIPPFMSLTALVLRAYGGRVHQGSLTAEIVAQIKRFREDIGAEPDFIDGHQHVHVLPIVRDAVFEAFEEARVPPHTLVRCPSDQSSRIRRRSLSAFKSLAISTLASRFRQECQQRGVVTNDGFSGVTTLDETANVTDEFVRAFSHPGRRHMVMSHPGIDSGDLLSTRRQAEYDALMTWSDLPELIWRPLREGNGRIDWASPRLADANATAV